MTLPYGAVPSIEYLQAHQKVFVCGIVLEAVADNASWKLMVYFKWRAVFYMW